MSSEGPKDGLPPGRAREAAREKEGVDRLRGDFAQLAAAVHQAEEGSIIFAGALSAPDDAERRFEFGAVGEREKDEVDRMEQVLGDDAMLIRRDAGMDTADPLYAIQEKVKEAARAHPGKKIVVDAPVMFPALLQTPLKMPEQRSEELAHAWGKLAEMKDSEAREWLARWVRGERTEADEDTPTIEMIAKNCEESLRALTEFMHGFGERPLVFALRADELPTLLLMLFALYPSAGALQEAPIESFLTAAAAASERPIGSLTLKHGSIEAGFGGQFFARRE